MHALVINRFTSLQLINGLAPSLLKGNGHLPELTIAISKANFESLRPSADPALPAASVAPARAGPSIKKLKVKGRS